MMTDKRHLWKNCLHCGVELNVKPNAEAHASATKEPIA